MLTCDYIVEMIDGDYAHLRRADERNENKTGCKSTASRLRLWKAADAFMRCWEYTLCKKICGHVDDAK